MLIDAKSFGEKVRTLRIQQGLTLADLAEKAQRSVSLLSQIGTANVSPFFSSMQTIIPIRFGILDFRIWI